MTKIEVKQVSAQVTNCQKESAWRCEAVKKFLVEWDDDDKKLEWTALQVFLFILLATKLVRIFNNIMFCAMVFVLWIVVKNYPTLISQV